jgi:hypothetical protein
LGNRERYRGREMIVRSVGLKEKCFRINKRFREDIIG